MPNSRQFVLELADLRGGHLVEDRQVARRRRDGVVGRRDRPLGVADPEAAAAEAGERLRAGDLVDEVEVDREHARRAALVRDDVVVPDLVDERARTRRAGSSAREATTRSARGGPDPAELGPIAARSSQYFWAGVRTPRRGERSRRSWNRRAPSLAVSNPVHREPPNPVGRRPESARRGRGPRRLGRRAPAGPPGRPGLAADRDPGRRSRSSCTWCSCKDLPRPAHPVVGWPLLAAAFALAELKVVEVHFRRETHAFSLSEFPAVIGFFSLAPTEYLAAMLLGCGAALARPAPAAADQDRVQPRELPVRRDGLAADRPHLRRPDHHARPGRVGRRVRRRRSWPRSSAASRSRS